jgi:hypothetical protein
MSPHYPVPSDEVLARIREDLTYSPTTGAIRWTNPCEPAGIESGDLAGYVDAQGYVRISMRVQGHRHAVKLAGHRVAWYLMTGKWPRFAIDHRDRNPSGGRPDQPHYGNRWTNLRRSTSAIEKLNKGLRSDNKSGVRGVWQRPNGRYEVKLGCDYEDHFLGVYPTLELAAEARYRAERDFYGRLCATSDRRCRSPEREGAEAPPR